MTTYLEFPRPYCLFTIQLLWACDDDYELFIGEIFIQEHFWPKISLFLGPIFDFWGFFGGLDIKFKF